MICQNCRTDRQKRVKEMCIIVLYCDSNEEQLEGKLNLDVVMKIKLGRKAVICEK